jgi:hypothetical protein
VADLGPVLRFKTVNGGSPARRESCRIAEAAVGRDGTYLAAILKRDVTEELSVAS